MRGLRSLALLLPALMLAMALSVGTALADNGGRPFSLALSGANEFDAAGAPINPHGDADRGSVALTINPGQEEVCWSFGAITLTAGDALPHVAHIHLAARGNRRARHRRHLRRRGGGSGAEFVSDRNDLRAR